jgi:zinc transport system ATP-binding protein
MRLPQNKMIELNHVWMQWDNRIALRDVSLSVNEGDFLAITGPNGGGKTTLLRIILKLLTPTQGEVLFRSGGKIVKDLPIGYLPQKNMIDSHFPITVEEVVSLGLYDQSNFSKEDSKKAVTDILKLVGMDTLTKQSIGRISGGQLQRALLARAIISRPEVLVLDEPLSYLDKQFEHRIYDIIASLAPTTTIILVSHEMSTIAAMANRHIIVDRKLHICHSANHFIHYDCCDNH